MLDAKPIPGTSKVVAVFSPGHGKKEHAGAITVVTPEAGPDERGSARQIARGEDFRDPYPLSEDSFLVAQGPRILMMDGRGQTRELYRLPDEWAKAGVECHEPRPLRPHARETVIPDRSAPPENTGRLVLSDVYAGRRMEGVRRGEIKKLLVLETLPKPLNDSGKMPPMSFGGTYTLNRVLGTVPVEPDGSAYMEVPALRSLFFVALDEHDLSVKRMQSFLTVMPGETTGCVGCHEHRTTAPANRPSPFAPRKNATFAERKATVDERKATDAAPVLLAMRREPSRIEPIAGLPDVFDFPRDIQPILDRHCVRCHDAQRPDGGISLSGDRGPIFSHSYYTLTARKLVSDGRDALVTNLPPRAIGTSASPLMRLLDGRHYDARPSPREIDAIRYWIESSAAYPGTYAALDTGMIGGYPKSQLDTSDRKWPASVAAAEAIGRRCTDCHDKRMPVPRYLSDDLGLVLSNPDPDDVRIRYSRHTAFNLTRPEKSLVLLAPLAKAAGGLELCKPKDGDCPSSCVSKNGTVPFCGHATTGTVPAAAPVFADTSDADYRAILALCREGKKQLDEIKRFDMRGFRPSPIYLREMRRYGILDRTTGDGRPINVYSTDQAYWRSHWWKPSNIRAYESR
jgi:hypothetical protein